MKFKLDENLPASATGILERAGHDVDSVIEEGLTGATDPDVVAAATAADRILISLDRGLGDIRSPTCRPPVSRDRRFASDMGPGPGRAVAGS